MPPNVLLVVFDTARRDVFSPYGAAPQATPAVAQLASRGVAAPEVRSTTNWTYPSHISMFSGMLPRAVGVPGSDERPGERHRIVAGLQDRMLPAVLRRSGYRTVGLSANLFVSPQTGFDLGFDEFEYRHDLRQARMEEPRGSSMREQLAFTRDAVRSRRDDGAQRMGRSLRDSIRRWSGEPTFWFVNLLECHSPYLPPRPWNDLPPWSRVQAALEARRYLNFTATVLYAVGRIEIPAAALERMRHLHTRAAAYLDNWLAGVLECLDERGILDETLVIVTSDHGENFGEDSLVVHGFSLDERLIRVPLVAAGPGADGARGLRSLAELPCLVADAVGLDEAPWHADDLPRGVSVSQHDFAEPHDPRISEFAEEHQVSEDGVQRLVAKLTAATDGETKLVVRDGTELVYDLTADPGESRPLDPSHANGSLDALRGALEHPAAALGRLPSVAGPVAPEPSPDEVAQLEQQMRELGYL